MALFLTAYALSCLFNAYFYRLAADKPLNVRLFVLLVVLLGPVTSVRIAYVWARDEYRYWQLKRGLIKMMHEKAKQFGIEIVD